MFGKLKTFRIALMFAFAMIASTLQAQTVTGNVKDSSGEPVIGATIMENGTKNGTITDYDGNFTIKLQQGGNLNVSYVGMKTQIVKTAGKTNFSIILQDDANTLGDVVVVGYGTIKKNDLTGSVSSVDTEKLNAKGAPSVMENLQGSTPGVNITQSSGRTGGGFNIEIRGKSSINSSTTPLYVVDGVMCDDIDWLNPQDIERIDILKDASSTAIYGSRATAGVVMVTTKGGLNVKKQEKATISYDGYYGWVKTARMPEFMTGEQFYQYRFLKFLTPTYELTNNAQINPGSPALGMADAATVEQCLLAYTKGENRYALKEMLASGNTYDWPGLVTRTGAQQNHYVSVAGSSEKVNYHMGIGYNDQKGIYEKDDQSRVNFKGSLDAKISKVVSAGFNFNLARQYNTYANDNGIQYAYRMNPYMVPYDEFGRMTIKSGNYEALGTDPSYQFSDQVSPLKILQNTQKERETWRVLGNVYLQFDIMKGLNFKTTFSPNYTYYRQGYFEGIKDPENPHHNFDNNAYEDLDSETGAYKPVEGHSSQQYITNRSFSYTWDNVVNWNKTFNKIHSVGVMGLVSAQYGNIEKATWASTDNTLDGSFWNSMQTSTYNDKDSKTEYSEYSMLSYALRANYGFDDRYLFTATVRWDGSSKFKEGRRWGCFPSFAAAWRITEEEFMKNVDWLSNLKLRVSYGITGNNAGIGYYDTMTTPVKNGTYYPLGGVYQNGYAASGIVDAELQWEKSHEFNVGIDFGFLRNRITGTIDWYNKVSKELLFDMQLPLEAGVDSNGKAMTMTTNVGEVRNRGLEFSLTTVNVQTKDWNWTTTLNFSTNINRVLQLNGISPKLLGGSSFGYTGTTGSLFVGRSTNVIYAFEQGGIVSDEIMTVPTTLAAVKHGFVPGEQVKSSDYYSKVYGWAEGSPIITDQNGDGVIDADNDRTYFRGDPRWTGSLTSNLSWKNWDFSFSIYAKVGQKIASNFLSEYLNYADRGRQHLNVDNYIPAGTLINCDGMTADGAYINPVYQEVTHYGEYPFPNNGGTNGFSTADQKANWDNAKCIVDGSFAKVKNITLGYTFPKQWLKPWGCSHLRLYFTVTNPFVITGYKGFDPEWASASLKNDAPSTVTYQLGASIKF